MSLPLDLITLLAPVLSGSFIPNNLSHCVIAKSVPWVPTKIHWQWSNVVTYGCLGTCGLSDLSLRGQLIYMMHSELNGETTVSLDPLKGLNLAAYTSSEWKGGGESVCSRVLFSERRPEGKLQENLTEVLWRQLWPLYTTHRICTCLYWIYQY